MSTEQILYAIIGSLFLVCAFFIVDWKSKKDDFQKQCDEKLCDHNSRLTVLESEQKEQGEKLEKLEERTRHLE